MAVVAQGRILIVDDDRIILTSLSEFLRLEGYEVETAEKFEEAVAWLAQKLFDIAITDVSMPEVDGFELLKYCRNSHPGLKMIMITGYGTIESAVDAIKMGAYDYLTKPIIDDEIKLVVERAMKQRALEGENERLRAELHMRYNLDSVVGNDYKMLRVYDLIEAVADSRATVLITGESGTGKSLIARTVHQHSSRRDRPFVEVACGALPETLLESELFGHVRGSFTGAVGDKQGKFEIASTGTIFLDEVSTASPGLQVKLLRVLQSFEFERVGGNETIKTDVRVILATNRDLMKDVHDGKFRQDLYYRINVVAIDLPPLRERISDIPLLTEHFLKIYCQRSGKGMLGFSDEAMRLMQVYGWPGNVRELENAIERATVLARGPRVELDDLPPALLSHAAHQASGAADDGRILPLKAALDKPEKDILERALKANGWNRQLTAEMLQINRTTLYKKMKKYGLDLPEPAARR
jgi:DNA-binding NtrC family response regulator